MSVFSLTEVVEEPGSQQIRDDPYLGSFAQCLKDRFNKYAAVKSRIVATEGSLEQFSLGYLKMGFNRTSEGIVYREWAPSAKEAFLVGDFSKLL